jgi:hypothetical protein
MMLFEMQEISLVTTESQNSLPGSLITKGITLLRKTISIVVLERENRIIFITSSRSTESMLKSLSSLTGLDGLSQLITMLI